MVAGSAARTKNEEENSSPPPPWIGVDREVRARIGGGEGGNSSQRSSIPFFFVGLTLSDGRGALDLINQVSMTGPTVNYCCLIKKVDLG